MGQQRKIIKGGDLTEAEKALETEEEKQAKAITVEEGEEKKKPLAKKRKKTKGKNILNAKKQIPLKPVGAEEAIELIKKTFYAHFDGAIEAHLNLGINPEKTDQQIRTNVFLPRPLSKKIKIALITSQPIKIKNKETEKAVKVGGDDLIEELKKTKKNLTKKYDLIMATPEMMPKIAAIGKILGPKGKMPNPKNDTLTQTPEKSIEQFIQGKIEIKSDAQGIVHLAIGKISWDNKKILENYLEVLKTINEIKPASVKKNYLKSIWLTSTMGPSVKIKL